MDIKDGGTGLDWSDRYLLGFDRMDEHHREFAMLVGKLLKSPPAQLAQAIDEFIVHAEHHFGDENDWMAQSDFPASECHMDEHRAVLESSRAVRAKVAAGEISAGYLLANNLAEWFPAHADYLDSALAQWVIKRKSGGAPVVLRKQCT